MRNPLHLCVDFKIVWMNNKLFYFCPVTHAQSCANYIQKYHQIIAKAFYQKDKTLNHLRTKTVKENMCFLLEQKSERFRWDLIRWWGVSNLECILWQRLILTKKKKNRWHQNSAIYVRKTVPFWPLFWYQHSNSAPSPKGHQFPNWNSKGTVLVSFFLWV